MRTFYYAVGDQRQGPVSAEDLSKIVLPPDTLVWSEGMPDWVPVREVPELKNLFASTPPPLPARDQIPPLPRATSNPTLAPARKGINKLILWAGAATIFIGAGIAVVASNTNSAPPSEAEVAAVMQAGDNAADQSTHNDAPSAPRPTPRPKTPEEMRIDLQTTELRTPLNYLSADGRYWKNLMDETVVEGDVRNSATLATYKDALVRFTFFSRSDTPIHHEDQRVYDYISPGSSVHFKFKFNAPSATDRVKFEVLRAAPVEMDRDSVQYGSADTTALD